MNARRAAQVWGISDSKVYQICRLLKIPKRKQGYEIPDDMKKPYIPYGNAFRKKDRLHVYIHVLNAITDELLIIPELIDTDEQHIKTAVRELKKTDAIVLLVDAEDNLDYQNYMIGISYSNWTLHNVKEKMKIVSGLLGIAKDCKEIVKAS